MTKEKTVEAEITIAADPDAVWRAITEGEQLKQWFSTDARVRPGVGGGMWMSFGEGMDWETPITLWEPGRHLRTEDPAPSKLAVDYYIEGKGGETVVRLVHSGFAADAWDDELETLDGGWRAFLAALKNYLERHAGESRTVVSFRHPSVAMSRAEAFPIMLDALGVPLVAEGEHFTSPIFEGEAEVVKAPINLSGRLSNLGGGFLMIELEPGRGTCRPSVWLSLFGDAAAEAPALQEKLQERVKAAFGS
ncbi:MAG TPA: SRPBCC domain-containing protein [Thermoanaerobaculia bacterium]|nr:SRPBCC domain-containing protein [Thermoanaerobaculia bacterium]